MDNLQVLVPTLTKSASRSPSPSLSSRQWNTSASVESSAMSRCKSPNTTRHERGSSADANVALGLLPHPRADAPGANVSATANDDPSSVDDDPDLFGPSSSFISNGSAEMVEDAEETKTRQAIEHMYHKITKTRNQIRGEQTARDDNVNEYLKLASNADKQQLTRIKAVFEKKNQKSAQSISQLQKKLDNYSKKLRELEHHGISGHRHTREVLRDVGQGLKSVMSKPREFAHLIRNKFGSADNINSLTRNEENNGLEEERTHHGSATLPGNCSLGGSGHGGSGSATGGKFASEENSECSSVTSESIPGANTASPHSSNPANLPPPPASLDNLIAELHSRKQEIDRLKDKLETFKQVMHKEVTLLNQALSEERFRSERLEEQVNDLTELHQNEVENLKTNISDMEEKVQYQSDERLRDIHEMLESCQTKISKMEHQQQQHQQYLTLEGLDNSNARALVVKSINVLLTILQVILLLVAAIAGIMMPFLRTRFRILTTVVVVFGTVVVMKQWPELADMSKYVVNYFKEIFAFK
ncbi:transmembrane and coiled-coil domains protein 2 isoform X2 [Nilaparvata lugens]|uniref:transmembrane and coiled-coil domains protein 2 isoform X2 n=2 Tax=Nilaparvata lugens TaxID=108931 RepID=UPI00193D537B|nr:transmembrane and coiled-coil domains protein 2 isoform X2 [Nilaparvata lugens]